MKHLSVPKMQLDKKRLFSLGSLLRFKLHLIAYSHIKLLQKKHHISKKSVSDINASPTLPSYYDMFERTLHKKQRELLHAAHLYTKLAVTQLSPAHRQKFFIEMQSLKRDYIQRNFEKTFRSFLKQQRVWYLTLLTYYKTLSSAHPLFSAELLNPYSKINTDSNQMTTSLSITKVPRKLLNINRSKIKVLIKRCWLTFGKKWDDLDSKVITWSNSLNSWDLKIWNYAMSQWKSVYPNTFISIKPKKAELIIPNSPSAIALLYSKVLRGCCAVLNYKIHLPRITFKRNAVTTVQVTKPTKVIKAEKMIVTDSEPKKGLLAQLFFPFWYTAYQYPKTTIFSIFLSVCILGGTYTVHEFIFKDLPSPIELSEQEQIVTSRILDRHGNLLYRIYQDENRTIIPLSEIPEHTIQATIAIEDKDFYTHHGFSVSGIFRAVISNIQGNPTQGGSTLTQQLVKNRLLSSEQTFTRKIKEVLLAVLAEGIYSKEQILDMYFNQIAYGGATYGIEEASQRYFSKPAKELTLAESALLAGLPAAPSVYSPFGTNPEMALIRQEEVLRRMVKDGYITQDEAMAAKQEKLAFSQNRIDIEAAHFVMYVRELLAQRYGEEVLTHGGLIVRTTLDLPLQQEMQSVITKEVDSLKNLKVSNGAGVITNPQTGEILAMVGSTNYFDFEHDGQVNVTLMPRQPGSSIKPLTYAMAMEMGKTPSSIIDDAPITYNIEGSKPYSPKNYDGSFHGKVTLRESLASSYNIPAVKLLDEIGVNNFISYAEDMGISTWEDRNRFGLSLTLGGGEIKMVDMAKAYSAFANQGKVTDLNPILEIRNYKGEQLYINNCALENKNCKSNQVISPLTAYSISDILSDNKARSPAFGPISNLYMPGQQVAVKTGTTNNLRDNWTIGYTTNRLTAIWVGNNDNTPMSYVASGVTGASPIWNAVMTTLVDKTNPHAFVLPDNLEKVAICTTTGTLACDGCPSVKEEYFIAGTAPTTTCNSQMFRDQPLAGQPPDLSTP